ncbi:MAG: site-2 protease family protein [Microthrixaceae bacterium]
MTVDERPSAGGEPPELGGDAADRAREEQDLAGVMGTRAGRIARVAVLVGLVVLLGVTRGLPILIVILAILVMIFLHELGHYIAAKRAGMKVTEFFIGFGPRIFSFRRGETEFGLKAVPAGAYVKIIGMSNLEEVDPEDEARTYRQAPYRSRASVAVAGSAMHFALALVLLLVQFALIGRPDGDKWLIKDVTPGSAAQAAGVRSGDRIVSFDGAPVESFQDFRDAISGVEPGRATVVVERGGRTETLQVDLSQRLKVVGTIGEDLDLIDSGSGVLVGGVADTGQAAGAGLSEGERVTAVNGQKVADLEAARAALARSVGGVVVLTTEGADATAEHRVDLGSAVAANPPAAFFGVGRSPVLVTDSVPAAAVRSVSEFGRVVGLATVGMARFLWPPNMIDFVTSTVSGDQDAASRPTAAEDTAPADRPISIVGIVLAGSELTSQNLSNLIGFLAGLNIVIGVFNLIPLLPFDGGHLVIASYEKAQEMRRRSRQRYLADVSRMLPVAYGVVMVLVVVSLLALYLDVTRGVST